MKWELSPCCPARVTATHSSETATKLRVTTLGSGDPQQGEIQQHTPSHPSGQHGGGGCPISTSPKEQLPQKGTSLPRLQAQKPYSSGFFPPNQGTQQLNICP